MVALNYRSFHSLSSKNITRLQNIQNCLARFVSGASRFSHVTPILKSLHLLPVNKLKICHDTEYQKVDEQHIC